MIKKMVYYSNRFILHSKLFKKQKVKNYFKYTMKNTNHFRLKYIRSAKVLKIFKMA